MCANCAQIHTHTHTHLPWTVDNIQLNLCTVKANSHVMLRPCRAALIHTGHAAPLPFSDSAVSFVNVHVVAGNIWTVSPTVEWIGMPPITTFMELRVVAGRSQTRAGCPHAVSGRPMLIHMLCHAHAALCRGLDMSLSEQHGCSMGVAWHVWIKHCHTA
jgi:hypothetical protein